MKFAVIGGDMRTVRLAQLLEADGHEVRAFGLEGREPERDRIGDP